MHNFMLDDIISSTQAFLAFAVFLIPPGYLTGAVTNVIGFRSRSFLNKVLIAIVLSVTVAPAIAVLVGRFTSTAVSMWFFVLIAAASLVLIVNDVRRQSAEEGLRPSRSTWISLSLVAIWVMIAVSQLVDWQIGDRVYISVTGFDSSVRTDFVQACVRTGVPPLNPYLFAHGHAPVMRYFYYWYVLCALPAKLAHLGARACLIASSAWCGIALAAVAVVFLKHFLGVKERLRRVALYTIALLAVTGLDLYFTAFNNRIPPDMEWWDPDQITSWFDSLLWVPHHVASLIACLAAFLVLWAATESASTRARIAAAVVAGLGFSSAAGLSVYVTFAFAIFMFLWTLSIAIEKRWQDLAMCIAAALGSLVFAAPYLHDLVGPGAVGGGFARFYMPGFWPLATLLVRTGLVNSEFGLQMWKTPMLFLHYLVELGFFFVVLVVRCKSDWNLPRSRLRTASWLMLASSLGVASFLRSAVIESNDLGWRAALIMQFLLLIWGAVLLDELVVTRGWQSTTRRQLLTVSCAAFLVIGVGGSLFQIYILRTYSWMSDQGKLAETSWLPQLPGIGERTYEIRSVFETISRKLPNSAVVQQNPYNDQYVPILLYSKYQFAAGGPKCGDAFGGDPKLCHDTVAALDLVYGNAATLPIGDLNRLCDDFDIDVLIAREGDPAWKIPNSWVWTSTPLATAQHIRAIPCGTRLAKQREE